MTSNGEYRASAEGLFRTWMDSARPCAGHISECRPHEADCNWMCDAFECMAVCCGNDMVGHVMDRFSTLSDARHEGLRQV